MVRRIGFGDGRDDGGPRPERGARIGRVNQGAPRPGVAGTPKPPVERSEASKPPAGAYRPMQPPAAPPPEPAKTDVFTPNVSRRAEPPAPPPSSERTRRADTGTTRERMAEAVEPSRVSGGGGLADWLRLLITLGVVVFAADIALDRIGGPETLLRLPQLFLDGDLDLAWLAEALLPPIVGAVIGIWLLGGLFAGFERRARRARPGPEYEAVTARDGRRAFEQLKKEHPEIAESAEAVGRGAKGCARVFAGGFLLLWLTGWSAGILFAGSELLRGLRTGDDAGATAFLAVWVSVAVIAWLFAVRALIGVARGEDLSKVFKKKRRG